MQMHQQNPLYNNYNPQQNFNQQNYGQPNYNPNNFQQGKGQNFQNNYNNYNNGNFPNHMPQQNYQLP